MEYKFFIGIDISKDTLDAACVSVVQPEQAVRIKVSNDAAGLGEMKRRLTEQHGFAVEQSVFCMEHTGIYNYLLLQFLHEWQANIWLENAVHLKRSLGLIRGKNDTVDAIRIAQYAQKNPERMRLWQPAREEVEKIRHLMALRERLLESRKRLQTPVEEFRQCGNEAMAKTLEKAMRKSIRALENDLEGVETQIRKVIEEDDRLKNLFQLATSVAGIGFVTATNLIIHTQEFSRLQDPRKLACYCGVAPFEYSSGTSVRRRTRVSHMANKKLKTNLHMASLSGVKLDEGLRRYYERKLAEGKNKMSVLNAVKNKLIARVLAVVKRGTPYQKNYAPYHLVLS